MTGRTYAQLCPIARALDIVGDRWSLLILRELHAGPARFSDLQTGLPGLAANLLTTRLNDLSADGLIEREVPGRRSAYRLTERGTATRAILLELAIFGARLPRVADPPDRAPHRHLAVALAAAAERALPPGLTLRAEILLDGQAFGFAAAAGKVSMTLGAPVDPPVRYATQYASLLPVIAGEIDFATHLARDATVTAAPGAAAGPFLDLIAAALDGIGGRA